MITNDGFILSMQRIPSGRRSSANGPPVLLQHGLLMVGNSDFGAILCLWPANFDSKSENDELSD